MTCKDNRDGSCSVEYTPTEFGEYDVSIQFAERHIPGSPFKVRYAAILSPDRLLHVFGYAQVTVDRPATAAANNVAVTGPGINPKYCRANTPVTFKVDATRCAGAANGNVDVKMSTDKGKESVVHELFKRFRRSGRTVYRLINTICPIFA